MVAPRYILFMSPAPSPAALAWVRGSFPSTEVVDIRLDEGASAQTRRALQRELPVLVLLADVERDYPLPDAIVSLLSVATVEGIERLTEVGDARGYVRQQHVPMETKHSTLVYFFPGPIFPVTMGARQRAFRLLLAFRRAGIGVDVVLPRADRKGLVLLGQLAHGIHSYTDRRKKLPKRLTRWRKASSMNPNLPPLRDRPEAFEDRMLSRATDGARITVGRLIEEGTYKHLLVNYAWMASVLDGLSQRGMQRITTICDTHDVQYVRSSSSRSIGWLPDPWTWRDRAVEVRSLRRFDKVLAISSADRATLSKAVGKKNVVLTPTGFDYIGFSQPSLDPEAPRFGFVGRDMPANVLSLRQVLRECWGPLRRRWPGATLQIAGTVCESEEIRRLAAHQEGVALLGFVADLPAFYSGIDVQLNPVLIQGGLNFKSVETVMAGRLLATNPRGLKCLGDARLATSYRSASELVARLEGLLANPEAFAAACLERRALAQELYGDEAAYSGILELVTPPEENQNPVALIQSGDLLDNWDRVEGLAQDLKGRGLLPVVLVYSEKFVSRFLARGFDAVALSSYSPAHGSPALDSLVAEALDDEATRDPEVLSDARKRAHARGKALRVWTLLDQLRPDVVFVWNGRTGIVANALRIFTRRQGMRAAFLERGLVRRGLYVDPDGVNGDSQLASLTVEELEAFRAPSTGEIEFGATSTLAEREALRQMAGLAQRRVVFVPLQVQRDTNIIRHSPRIKKMFDLVELAIQEFAGDEDVVVVVRPHPEEVDEVRLPAHPQLVVTSEGDLATWIDVADCVLTINSTVGLEALIAGKRVRALGRGIFTKPGLIDTKGDPSAEVVETFVNVLLCRYTCTPDRGARVATEIVHGLKRPSDAPRGPFNPFGLSPDVAATRWKEIQRAVREAVSAGRAPGLLVRLGEQSQVQLTYRTLLSPVPVDWLKRRAKEVFSLDGEGDSVELIDPVQAANAETERPVLVVMDREEEAYWVELNAFLDPFPSTLGSQGPVRFGPRPASASGRAKNGAFRRIFGLSRDGAKHSPGDHRFAKRATAQSNAGDVAPVPPPIAARTPNPEPLKAGLSALAVEFGWWSAVGAQGRPALGYVPGLDFRGLSLDERLGPLGQVALTPFGRTHPATLSRAAEAAPQEAFRQVTAALAPHRASLGLVVVEDPSEPLARAFVWACRHLRIPTVSFPSPGTLPSSALKTDIVWCESEELYGSLSTQNVDQCRLVLVQGRELTALPTLDQEGFRASLGLLRSGDIVVLAVGKEPSTIPESVALAMIDESHRTYSVLFWAAGRWIDRAISPEVARRARETAGVGCIEGDFTPFSLTEVLAHASVLCTDDGQVAQAADAAGVRVCYLSESQAKERWDVAPPLGAELALRQLIGRPRLAELERKPSPSLGRTLAQAVEESLALGAFPMEHAVAHLFTDHGERSGRGTAVFRSIQDSRMRYVASMLAFDSVVEDASVEALRRADVFLSWGIDNTIAKQNASSVAAALGLPCVSLEDGFLRSVDIGLSGVPGLSIIVDTMGPYYDAGRPSRLEQRLNGETELSPAQLERARACMRMIVEGRVSKYNHAPDTHQTFGTGPKILLVDQRFGDLSVLHGSSGERSFRDMVDWCLENRPDHMMLIKRHPDATKGGKNSYFTEDFLDFLPSSARWVLIDSEVNPHTLFDQVDEVLVVTSGMGLEALIAGKKVRCFGSPFYSGWGPTDDQVDCGRRWRRRTVEELFHFAYIEAARYYSPILGRCCEIEDTIRYIVSSRDRMLGVREPVGAEVPR